MKGLFPDPLESVPLSAGEIEESLDLLLDAAVPAEEKTAFLHDLHRRGETGSELADFSRRLLARAVVPDVIGRKGLLELCGTGGDRAGYLNVSTAAMFVAAGAGARVVKHGNRAFSSRCGSADVLEALGINLHLDPSRVGDVLDRAGCVFLLAADFHPAFAALAPLRRDMAARGMMTVFNLLGPLLNPALPEFQMTGIYSPSMTGVYADAMSALGRRHAWAVHGMSKDAGIDELSIFGASRIRAVRKDQEMAMNFEILPEDAGLNLATDDSSLRGGDASENAARILSILAGGEESAATDMILLNAGGALHVAGIGESLAGATSLARQALLSGRALSALKALREASSEVAR